MVSMGHQDVFVHVGDQVRIQTPNGRWVAPIVTGTFTVMKLTLVRMFTSLTLQELSGLMISYTLY